MILPNIPRLYTALAEVLAVLLYARRLPRRFHRQTAVTVVWALVLGIFLHKTGYVPLAWWVPCMLCAVLLLFPPPHQLPQLLQRLPVLPGQKRRRR